jgi:hypothetical protein
MTPEREAQLMASWTSAVIAYDRNRAEWLNM